jgi:hypothetical protein
MPASALTDMLLLLLLLPQALRQTRSGSNTTFVTPAYNCYVTRAGTSTVEPLIPANQTGYVAGITDRPNRGPKTIGYSPARDVVMCWQVGLCCQLCCRYVTLQVSQPRQHVFH